MLLLCCFFPDDGFFVAVLPPRPNESQEDHLAEAVAESVEQAMEQADEGRDETLKPWL